MKLLDTVCSGEENGQKSPHWGSQCPSRKPGENCSCLCDHCMTWCEKLKQIRIGRRSRAKGKKAQKAAKKQIGEALGLAEDELFSAVGGIKEDDIRGSEEFRQMFGFAIEVKNEKKPRLEPWIAQVEEDEKALGRTLPWLIVFKRHRRSKFYALLEFTELLKLLKARKHEPVKIDQSKWTIVRRGSKPSNGAV